MEVVTIAAILSLAICDAPPGRIARPITTEIRACVRARLRYSAAKYLIGIRVCLRLCMRIIGVCSLNPTSKFVTLGQVRKPLEFSHSCARNLASFTRAVA